MKTACNSAYVQTETLNFIFAWQAILYIYIFVPTADVTIVAMTLQHYNFTLQNSLLLRRSQNIGNGVTFLHIFCQPHFNLELDYIE